MSLDVKFIAVSVLSDWQSQEIFHLFILKKTGE